MRVRIRIDALKAINSGEARAEPYIWPFFFKVDELLFGDVLRGRIECGRTDLEDLKAWGLALHELPEEATALAESFVMPGGAHRNLPPMRTGQIVEIDLEYSTRLRHGGALLRRNHALIGIAAILYEEDLMPGNSTVKKAYAAWTSTMQARVRAAVSRRMEASPKWDGPFSFGYRGAGEPERPSEVFDPITLQAELTKKMPKVHRGFLIDRDDFIGAMVWCVSAAELKESRRLEYTQLWTPATGSEEGSWELYCSAEIR